MPYTLHLFLRVPKSHYIVLSFQVRHDMASRSNASTNPLSLSQQHYYKVILKDDFMCDRESVYYYFYIHYSGQFAKRLLAIFAFPMNFK